MPQLNLSSFHDYDIRGVYQEEIDENFYYHLGKAVALYIGEGPIAVGHDARTSSPTLTASLIEGITDYGVDVVSLGQISTEMHNFACGKYGFAANIAVTASHNPGKYNGAKIAKRGVIPLHSGFGLPEIKKLIVQDLPKSRVKGAVTTQDIFKAWIEHCLTFIKKDTLKPFKVIVDGGNGMGGPSWMAMQNELPCEIVPMYLDPDGTFPNHEANPLKDENTHELQERIKKEGADLGIALDGDADRIFFIDETGTKLSGTVTTAILASHFLKHEKGYILYNAICGRIVKETTLALGGTPLRTRVGHSFIKEAMKKYDGIVAGEHSGHFYFRDCFYAESTLIAGLLMMQFMSDENVTLSSIRKQFDIYPESGEINFVVKNRDMAAQNIREKYQKEAAEFDELDGYSFWYPDWWFNVRLSKTEPLLRLNIEADNESILEEKVKILSADLESMGALRK